MISLTTASISRPLALAILVEIPRVDIEQTANWTPFLISASIFPACGVSPAGPYTLILGGSLVFGSTNSDCSEIVLAILRPNRVVVSK